MHLAARRSAAVARPLRSRLHRPGTSLSSVHASAGSSRFGASRSFSASSFMPRNFFGSSGGSSSMHTSKTARAAAFFLDAKAACKGKRCALGKNGSGIVSAPESCGEDSYFVSPSVVGVADGVGGWNENGVDPGEISRSLMRNASAFVKKNTDANVEITTKNVLAYGYKQALLDDNVEAGSTTACIVRVKESEETGAPILEYSNLGDSGFVIIRDNAVIFRSKFQYYGRAPYQLAKIPQRFKSYGAIENHPNDADSGEIEVQDGDIIVLATDGVWDNFAPNLARTPTFQPPLVAWRRSWHSEIASLVGVVTEDPEHAAENVVKAAVRHNLKPDDVTVIVAKVVKVAAKL
ncbi:Protein phosphatase, partial [Globisporangium splendens]